MRAIRRLLIPALIALLLAGSVACDRSRPAPEAPEPAARPAEPDPEPEASPDPEEAEPAEPEVAQKDVETLIVGEAPGLPPVLDGVELGAARAEVDEQLPHMTDGGILRAEAYEGRFFNLAFDDAGRLARIWFGLPADRAEKLLTDAWGSPETLERYDETLRAWFAPEAGIRATLSEGFGEDLDLELTRYLPADALVGEGEGLPFGFEADQPLLGADLEAIREAYPRAIRERTAEEAKARLQEIETLTGEEIDPAPEAIPTVHLDLPPTEYDVFFTRVHLDLNEGGEVTGYRFGLGFGGHDEAKADLLDLLKARLGEPEVQERFGEDVLVFREDGPRIEVVDDAIGEQWDVRVIGD